MKMKNCGIFLVSWRKLTILTRWEEASVSNMRGRVKELASKATETKVVMSLVHVKERERERVTT